MDFYLGYSIHRLQVTLIIQPGKSEARLKAAFKADDPNTPTDKHVNSKYLLAQLNFSFSNQFCPRLCTLNTCFTTFHRMEKDWVFPLSGYWECSREVIAVQLWVHWLGLLDMNTNPDFSLQECLELNSVRAPTHQAEKANTSSHVSWSMTLGHANTQNLWQMQLQP